MPIFHQLQDKQVAFQPCIFTFGTFDGVHLGHKYIFEQVKKQASLHQCQTACLTFPNHPSELLSPDSKTLQLTSHRQKIALLQSFGFDYILDIPFDIVLQHLSAAAFIGAIRRMIPFSCIAVGSDVTFGNHGEGNKDFLKKMAEQFGFQALFFDRFCIDNIPVSSSHIRPLIMAGDFAQAEGFLGRSYSLICPILKTTYPQIDLNVAKLVIPPCGVYAVSVQIRKQKYRALAYLSRVKQPEGTMKIYMFETYEGQETEDVEVHFLKFLRPDKHFTSQEELQAQIEKDKQLANAL